MVFLISAHRVSLLRHGEIHILQKDNSLQLEANLGYAEDSVPLLVYVSDLDDLPTQVAVPLRHFDVDSNGRPVGLSGPRVRIVIPTMIPLRIGGLSLQRADMVPNPLRPLAPNRSGDFVYESGSASIAMSTAFHVASKVLDLAERWTGHRVDWGRNGQLSIVASAFALETELNFYDARDDTVFLGALRRRSLRSNGRRAGGNIQPQTLLSRDLILQGARSPDIVAHEVTHAALAAIKPGHKSGIAAAIGEGVADAMTFLVAFIDSNTAQKILIVTGEDLRQDNEASRFREFNEERRDYVVTSDHPAYWRSMRDIVTPRDCGIGTTETRVSALSAVSSGRGGIHHIGQIISGTLYEFFVSLYEKSIKEGMRPVPAAGSAAETVGTLTFRAFRFVGENKISLSDFASGLLQAEIILFDGLYREMLMAALKSRDLIGSDESVEAMSADPGPYVPQFRIDSGTVHEDDIVARIEELEEIQLRTVEKIDWTMQADRASVPLIRHRASAFVIEEIGVEDLTLYSDIISADGFRTIRLRYFTSTRLHEDAARASLRYDWSNPDLTPNYENASGVEVFVSIVLDGDGKMIALHADKPNH